MINITFSVHKHYEIDIIIFILCIKKSFNMLPEGTHLISRIFIFTIVHISLWNTVNVHYMTNVESVKIHVSDS